MASVLSPAEWLHWVRLHCRVDEDGCWVWRGCTNGRGGYPVARHDGRTRALRPLVYRWAGNNASQVAVTCGKRRCLNPACMYPTSQRARGALLRGKPRDAGHAARAALGRHAAGINKLNIEVAREVRRRVAEGEKQITLSRELRVCRDTISKIVVGKHWREPSPWAGLA